MIERYAHDKEGKTHFLKASIVLLMVLFMALLSKIVNQVKIYFHSSFSFELLQKSRSSENSIKTKINSLKANTDNNDRS